MDPNFHDLVIVGAGPAGLTAGLYAARSKRDTILLEKLGAGGQVLTTEWIENYPGFPEGIGGFEIIDRMKKQAERFGLLMENEEVLSLLTQGPQIVLTTPAKRLFCRSVILASGAQARKLGVEGEGSLTGKGVSYCATCDGPFFTDAVVTVVGGGDTTIEEAIYLTKFAAKVFVVHRRGNLANRLAGYISGRENPGQIRLHLAVHEDKSRFIQIDNALQEAGNRQSTDENENGFGIQF